MITDNRHIKISLVVIAIILSAATLLSSCSPNTSSYEHLFEGGMSDLDEIPVEVDDFIIVVPAECSGAVYDATISLAEKIKEKTSSDTRVLYDYQEVKPKTHDMLILVGKTDYEESQRFLRDFRKDDFGYTYSDQIVLIGGACDESLLSAIEKFRQDVVLYADSELFISSGTEYIFRADYTIKRIELNGFQLFDYTLVYPKDNSDDFAAATYFQKILADNTGYYLDIKSDSQADKNSRAICIGKTKLDTTLSDNIGKGASLISEYPSGISLISDNFYTMKKALDSLLSILCSTDSSAVSKVQISSYTPDTVAFEEITITDISSSSLASTDLLRNTANTILNSSLSIIRLSDVSDNTACSLFYTLGNKYSMISFGNSADKRTHYIYKNSEYIISYEDFNEDSTAELYLVKCSDISSNTSFFMFEIGDLLSNTQETALSVTKKISSIISDFKRSNGAVFFKFSETLDSSLANTLINANRLSANLYTFGDGTFFDTISEKNGITHIELTLYH